jgi:hypothetical protein
VTTRRIGAHAGLMPSPPIRLPRVQDRRRATRHRVGPGGTPPGSLTCSEFWWRQPGVRTLSALKDQKTFADTLGTKALSAPFASEAWPLDISLRPRTVSTVFDLVRTAEAAQGETWLRLAASRVSGLTGRCLVTAVAAGIPLGKSQVATGGEGECSSSVSMDGAYSRGRVSSCDNDHYTRIHLHGRPPEGR